MKPQVISKLGSLLLLSTALAVCATSGCASGAATVAGPGGKGPGSPATDESTPAELEASRPIAVLPAHFEATVYEVQAPAERLRSLDAKTLTAKAATVEKLRSALSAVGTVRVLYRIDQPVDVYSEQITVGGSEPVVVGARVNSAGQSIKTVSYQNVGVIFRLKAQAPAKAADRKGAVVTMSVQLAALAPSGTEIAPGVNATATRTVSLEHSEPLRLGRPGVMLSVSSTASDAQAPPAAYVIRYLFSPPASK